jgi:SpoVK/Ycf46/Vps4 family AAA+-type ATPase
MLVNRIPLLCMFARHAAVVRLEGVPQVVLDAPPVTAQARARAFDRDAADAPPDTLGLSRRFAFVPDEIGLIREEAAFYRFRRAGSGAAAEEDWICALRQRARQNFGNLAQRIEPQRTIDDLIVSPELRRQLVEIRAAIRFRGETLDAGFGARIHYGTGISALFHGPSGTGKTMAAEVLAGDMRCDLIKVDLSSVVNKYIGETEKNLSKLFDMAEADSGVLFFDEADALFGKRSEVKDAQDRHANIEVAYLLQRLEAFPGLVILATNNRGHMDEAFIRRFTFVTRFAHPDATLREAMWRAIWPAQLVVDEEVDFADLARRIDVTGANIRNIALLACWLAKLDGSGRVMKCHVEQASLRELAKLGRLKL